MDELVHVMDVDAPVRQSKQPLRGWAVTMHESRLDVAESVMLLVSCSSTDADCPKVASGAAFLVGVSRVTVGVERGRTSA